MRLYKIFIPALLTLSIASALQAKSVSLEYKYQKGDTSKYRIFVDVKTSIPGAGNSSGVPVSALSTKMTADVTENVVSVYKNGAAVLHVTTNNIQMLVMGMKSPEMKPTTVTMTVAKNGKILNGSLSEGLPGSMPVPCETMMSQWIPLPAGPVEVGRKWSETIPIADGGSLKTVSTLQAAAVLLGNETVSQIGQQVTVNVDLTDAMAEAVGNRMPATSNKAGKGCNRMRITGKSVCSFAPARGRLVKSTGTFVGKMKMLLPSSGGQSKPMDIIMTMKVSVAKVG